MSSQMEYHVCVRHPFPVSVALLGAVLLILASMALAQSIGTPSTGTAVGSVHTGTSSVIPYTGAVIPHTGAIIPSTGSVRPPTGTVPVVTFSGTVPNSRVTFSGSNGSHDNDDHHRRHHDRGAYAVPFLYAYPVPYAVDYAGADDSAESDANADDDEADYQGGPTVFDRRGSGADSYVPPVTDSTLKDGAPRSDIASAVLDRPQASTLIVFKDGHTVELGNYAIIGATLFDLTPGHTRKVALSDLDLAATQRQNDDRGVSFALPAPPQAN